ncbi:glycosyltransferase family 39 protein [Emticicia sp. SJ17W-69]|uniref:glycosyltransferase family 39 protein n=1 Tax=Emticicia sp. SJ17W-69 TaxID=3421657 RepID=UPI003EBB36C8
MQVRHFLKKNIKLILLGILLVAFGLRFYKIGEHGLAGDEKYSLFVSQFVTYEGNNQHDSVRKPNNKYFTPKEFWSEKSLHDFFDAIARLDTGNGALYTYSLHLWTKCFGVSDLSLRLPSLLFNLLTISLLFVFVKRHFRSENLALLAVFLAAISPFYIAFSQVARNYCLNMFFALLSTHLLLIIIENEERDKKPFWIYIFYGFCATACEMCHFSTFPLFFIHAIFVLIYFRKLRGYIGLSLSMLIPLLMVGLWLKSDGGAWVFEYIQNSTKVYNEMARLNPDEYLSIATAKSVLKQIRHVISAMFLLIDGFPNLLPSHKKVYFLVLFTSLVSFALFIRNAIKLSDKQQKKLRVFMLLLSFLPIISLVAFAFQDGNTFRIMPRYVAYAYGFNLVLIALIIKDIWVEVAWKKYPILGVFMMQFLIVNYFTYSVWQDNPPRYFMGFSQPRKPNPYQLVADKIQCIYAKGDTIIYPSTYFTKEGRGDMPSYSVVDAQLTNFYLPKNSEIIQRVEPSEPNKIILRKVNGEDEVIFDFEGTKYRY